MAVPLASIAAKVAKKIALDVLTDPEKGIKYIFIAVAVPIVVLLLFFAIPAMMIVSIPSLLFGGNSPLQQKYIAMYQKAPIQIEERNQDYIKEKKEEYKDYDEIEVNYDYTLTWQELMAVDTALLAQDFSKSSEQHILDLGEKFMTRKVTTRSIQRTESYTGDDGEKHTKTVTIRIATITVTTKSFDAALNILGMDSFKQLVAKNVYRLLLTKYSEGSGAVADGMSAEIPLFHQWDERWGNNSYGSGETIATSGCGPTSVAMIITGLQGKMDGLDTNGDDIVDPGEAASYSLAHGYRVQGQGTAWGFFADIGHKAGLNVREYSKSQYQQVYDELKKGNPIIASMGPGHFTQGGHFIVLVGLTEDGKIKVNDPNKQECSDTPWDFESIIVPEAVEFWAFDNPNRASIGFLGTAYTGRPSEGGDMAANGTSLAGKDLRNKLIAVDPTVIPMGTKVLIKAPDSVRYQIMPDGEKIDVNGYYTAVDTGSAIKGYHVDIYFGNGQDYVNLAETWGTQTIQLYVKK